MDEIKKLMDIVQARSPQNLPLLDLPPKGRTRKVEKDQRELVLFKLIENGEVESDEEAAQYFYQCSPNDERYKSLKYRLKQKLLNHLFFLDLKDTKYRSSSKYELRCLELFFKGRALVSQSEYKNSEKILKNCLKTAQDYDYTYLGILCTEQLMHLYSVVNKYKAFYNIKKSLKKYYDTHKAEVEARELFYMSKIELNRSLNSRKKYFNKVPKIIIDLKELWKQNKSYIIYDYYYKLNIFYLELKGDFESIIQITHETDKLLASGEINAKRFDQRYHMFIIVYAYLRNRDFEKGLELAEQFKPNFPKVSPNTFVYMENYFLMAMHAQKYDLALKILKEAYQNMESIKLPARAAERWNLYSAYLYFVKPDEKLLGTFEYQIFFVEAPNYRKDKQGFNVAILILQFLFYLKRNDLDALFYRADSLRKYAGKHLKDNVSLRSKMFFRLLIMVVDKEMDIQKIRRKGWYTYNKLKSTPIPGDAYSEIEIIPYEHLWEMILSEIGGAKALEEWKEKG